MKDCEDCGDATPRRKKDYGGKWDSPQMACFANVSKKLKPVIDLLITLLDKYCWLIVGASIAVALMMGIAEKIQ